MKVMRKMEVLVDGDKKCFKIGDRIHVGEYYTATCQKVGKNGAIFMFDQYLDKARMMNLKEASEGDYKTSDLRKFLKEFATSSVFDEIREMMVPFKKTGDLLRIPTAEEVFDQDPKRGWLQNKAEDSYFAVMDWSGCGNSYYAYARLGVRGCISLIGLIDSSIID